MVAKSVKMVKALIVGLIFSVPYFLVSQGSFAPQAGESGSTAISKDSAIFRDWAISCEVKLGLRQIDIPDSGFVSSGIDVNACGKPNAPSTISLGDSGVATVSFMSSIFDGPGFDFAIFENGFGSSNNSFLELAFVEVSSDGKNFIRIPSYSEMDTLSQLGTFDMSDASFYHNLAGKYVVNYGTPFNLSDIPDTSLLDKQHVTHVRIVDVIGTLQNEHASRDALGRKINDPWPTNFSQGGFDLDAVMVINSNLPVGIRAVNSKYGHEKSYFDILGSHSDYPFTGFNIEVNNSGIEKKFNSGH